MSPVVQATSRARFGCACIVAVLQDALRMKNTVGTSRWHCQTNCRSPLTVIILRLWRASTTCHMQAKMTVSFYWQADLISRPFD